MYIKHIIFFNNKLLYLNIYIIKHIIIHELLYVKHIHIYTYSTSFFLSNFYIIIL
jgi:hypothetical protein